MSNIVEWIIGSILILSSLGVIAARKPVYASLSFLVTLLSLAVLYIQLSAQFVGVMQILVYAGAILVIFIFVVILFQDAHMQIENFKPLCKPQFLIIAGVAFALAFIFLAKNLTGLQLPKEALPSGFGSVQSLGEILYIDFFFPFEIVILLFLVALVGSLYIGKKGN